MRKRAGGAMSGGLQDVPDGATAVGVPARIVGRAPRPDPIPADSPPQQGAPA